LLVEQLRKQWRTRDAGGPIAPFMNFKAAGLVLGADTVLAAAASPGAQAIRLEGEQDRALALLSVAYNRPVTGAVLGHLRHATKRWSEGDNARAAVHLALTGLGALPDPDAPERLFLADRLMKAGVTTDIILAAFGVADENPSRAAKAYNPNQPRQPAGSPKGGEWAAALEAAVASWFAARSVRAPHLAAAVAAGGRASAGSAPEVASILSGASKATMAWLSRYGLQAIAEAGGAAAGGLGLAFIPVPMGSRAEGDVTGIKGLSYRWNQDEPYMVLTYKGPDGVERRAGAELSDGDVFRNRRGQIVGRVLANGVIALDIEAAIKTFKNDKPNLCPAQAPDKPGQSEKYDQKHFEDYVKRFINPDNPTPRGIAYYMRNPSANGDLVSYDDCQHDTGAFVEVKGPRFGAFVKNDEMRFEGIKGDWLDQSLRQIQASDGHPVDWVFAEPIAAQYAQKIFQDKKQGREKITVLVLPWKRGMK
jgi:hypothetical protein